MLGMMQEKPQPSIRHIQATGRAALKLGTTNIAWPRSPCKRAQSGESTAHGKLCFQRRNHRHGNPLSGKISLAQKSSQARRCAQKKKKKIHNAPNTSIQEPGIFVMTGKIWEYQNNQNKGAMDVVDRAGKNCKGCGNGNGYVVCLCFPAWLPIPLIKQKTPPMVWTMNGDCFSGAVEALYRAFVWRVVCLYTLWAVCPSRGLYWVNFW